MYLTVLNRLKTLIIVFLVLFVSCQKEEGLTYEALKLQNSYSLKIAEPSGLSFSSSKSTLYVVSDNTNKIYKITLTGRVLSALNFSGSDLEGVCYDNNTDNIWVIEERERKLIEIDLQSNVIKRISLDIDKYSDNKGLEGITINNKTGYLYIVNESSPSILIELNDKQQIVNKYSLNFASDYSGIFYDEYLDKLWIISDESSTITKCDLKGNAEKTYKIGINKAEGVVVDSKNNKIYIVSDSSDKLYIFSL